MENLQNPSLHLRDDGTVSSSDSVLSRQTRDDDGSDLLGVVDGLVGEVEVDDEVAGGGGGGGLGHETLSHGPGNTGGKAGGKLKGLGGYWG